MAYRAEIASTSLARASTALASRRSSTSYRVALVADARPQRCAAAEDARRSIFVDANATLFSSQYAYDAKLWARPACFADYFDERAAPPALIATGRTPFAMHFNGPAGRYRLGWCAATLLRTTAEDEGAAGAYFVDLDAGGRRVPVARLCGGALASTATIGAARGRSVTPTVPCDAPGQRRVECTNDHCKWA